MTIEKTNTVIGFDVTLMGDTTSFLGWIRLHGTTDDAGYIYLDDTTPREVPRLGGKGYVVMTMATAQLPSLLAFLSTRSPLTIRFFDPQVPNGKPSAALYSDREGQTGISLPKDEAAFIAKRLGLQLR